jgi:hypothetical protein
MSASDRTRPQPPRQDDTSLQDELLLLDALLGEDVSARAQIEARLQGDATLRARRSTLDELLAAERHAFEDSAFADSEAEAREAIRVAAWIRDRARSEADLERRTAARERQGTPQRGWARLLAWSVALHVLVLGLLAFALREDAPAREEHAARIALSEDEGYFDEPVDALDSEFARAYPQLEWRDVSRISDELVLREQDAYEDDLPSAFDDAALAPDAGALPSGRRGAFDQPVGVVAAAVRRTNQDLKRRRLDLLGFSADGTLRAVEKGLDYLAPRQGEDGSWSGVTGGRSDLEQTAITLLAFLGDGNASHAASARKGRGEVVARGVRWLRDQLFNASASDAERAAHLEQHPVSVLGPATVALCEDYMLSYGWLSPAAAESRAREIAQLAARLEKQIDEQVAADVSGQDAVERPWAVWGQDAASRVGVVASSASHLRAFRDWVQTASSAKPTLSAMSFLSVGTALLYSERGAEKPRFLAWSRSNAGELASKLGPGGFVRSGDPIGETALVLLGLQVAYRTY